jgi:hypothetical protein
MKTQRAKEARYRLYRFYNADGDLLYIGQTGRYPLHRLGEHLRDKPWVAQIATWKVDPRVWVTETDVLRAEERAIRTEKPKHNVVHNDGRPFRESLIDVAARFSDGPPVHIGAIIGGTVVAVWLGAAAVMWWFTSDRPQAAALIAGGVALVGYPTRCWLRPFGDCRRCKGTGKIAKWTGRRQVDCGRCDGSGMHLRFGRRLWNWWRARRVV